MAEEVRQLAERATESTREIGHLIGYIQSAVEAAVHDMEAGISHVEAGTELTDQARFALKEILEAITRTDNLARTIWQASAEMAKRYLLTCS